MGEEEEAGRRVAEFGAPRELGIGVVICHVFGRVLKDESATSQLSKVWKDESAMSQKMSKKPAAVLE